MIINIILVISSLVLLPFVLLTLSLLLSLPLLLLTSITIMGSVFFTDAGTANFRNIVDFGGFDSSIILIQRGGIPRPVGDLPQSLSQAMLVGCNVNREIVRNMISIINLIVIFSVFHDIINVIVICNSFIVTISLFCNIISRIRCVINCSNEVTNICIIIMIIMTIIYIYIYIYTHT